MRRSAAENDLEAGKQGNLSLVNQSSPYVMASRQQTNLDRGHPSNKSDSTSHQLNPGTTSCNTSNISSPASPATNQQSQQHPNSDSQKESDLQTLLGLIEQINYHQASNSPLPSVYSENQQSYIEKIYTCLPLILNIFRADEEHHQQQSNRYHVSSTGMMSNYSSLDRDGGELNSLFSESTISLATRTPTSPLPPRDLYQIERYPMIQEFGFTIARLFVSEVRTRASNKGAEEASLAILKFLNPNISKVLIDQCYNVTTMVDDNKKEESIRYKSEKELSNTSDSQIFSNSSLDDSVDVEAIKLAEIDSKHGWELLLSLDTIINSAQRNSKLYANLAKVALPSTMMKCLYLFFDMENLTTFLKKKISSSSSDHQKQGKSGYKHDDSVELDLDSNSRPDEEINAKLMAPLIKVFTEILVQLCYSKASIDELIKKDDLRLLFSLASTQCEKHNRPWRYAAFETLSAISITMRDNFSYLQTNHCIQTYVDNMQKINTVTGDIVAPELLDMTKVLSLFVYNLDSNNRNQIKSIWPITDQLKSSRFLELLEELIFKIDDLIKNARTTQEQDEILHQTSKSKIESYRRLGIGFIKLIPVIAKINATPESMSELMTLKPIATVRHTMNPNFRTPKPSAQNCVLNLEALSLIKTAWSRCHDSHLIETILDSTISLFHQDKYNYFIFENQQLLVYYLSSINFTSMPVRLKQKLLKFIEFITIETNYIPCLELGTLGSIMKQEACQTTDLILILKTLIACSRVNSTFSDIFRDVGLLEIVTDLLIKIMLKQQEKQIQSQSQLLTQHQIKSASPNQSPNIHRQQSNIKSGGIVSNNNINNNNNNDDHDLEVLYLSMEVCQSLLSGPNCDNCKQFNESGAARQVFLCLSKPHQFYPTIQQHSSTSSEESADLSQSNSPSHQSSLSFRCQTPPLTNNSLTINKSINNATLQTPNLYHTANHHRQSSMKQIQKVSFSIIRQLIMSGVCDEYLANLLGLLSRNMEDLRNISEAEMNSHLSLTQETLQTTDPASQQLLKPQLDITSIICQEINLKICVLKSLMIVLKENHRCRAAFRKTGGFLCIVSGLESLSNCLPASSDPMTATDEEIDKRKAENVAILRQINARRIWRLIKSCLMTIVIAMRSEPSNMRSFNDEALVRFTKAISALGCFCKDRKHFTPSKPNSTNFEPNTTIQHVGSMDSYKSTFLAPPTRDYSTIPMDNIEPDAACCQLFRFLYDMSLDMGDGTGDLELALTEVMLVNKMNDDKPVSLNRSMSQQANHGHAPGVNSDSKSISFDRGNIFNESNMFNRRSQLNSAPMRPPSLDLNSQRQSTPANLTFPSLILSIVDLIPLSPNEQLMTFVSLVVKCLFKRERNRQLLCEAGLISKLLEEPLLTAVTDKGHFLHNIFEFIFEKLSKESMTTRQLSTFLRIGNPMLCQNLDEINTDDDILCQNHTNNQVNDSVSGIDQSNHISTPSTSTPVILRSNQTRDSEKIKRDKIESLVAMISPNTSQGACRSGMREKNRDISQPPYVEFDMSIIGSGLIFMPSIAPINAKLLAPHSCNFLRETLGNHLNEKNGVLGGIGVQERPFPPQSGLTFSSWICINNFPQRSPDSNHNIRLLTIYRGTASTGKEYSCLRIELSALDRALMVSTQEMALFDSDYHPKSRLSDNSTQIPECNIRIWTPELLLENRWHHLAITMSRTQGNKQMNIVVYVDGVAAHSDRISYISRLVGPYNTGPLGQATESASPAVFVNAFIGALPQFRSQPQVRWKQGPFHLIEEPLSSPFIAIIYALGPKYIGNFQSSIKLNELARDRLLQLAQSDVKFFKQLESMTKMTTSQHHSLSSLNDYHHGTTSPDYQAHHQLARGTSAASGSTQYHHRPTNDTRNALTSSPSSVNSNNNNHNNSNNQYTLPEERLLMSVHARATSLMSYVRMRKIYTRFDCRQISRVLSLQENSTPLLVLHNTGLHLTGPSRGAGAVAIGYNLVRHFAPSPVHQTLVSLGGNNILLAFVAQAETVQSLEISMMALVSALKQNPILQAQMESINGYQILSMFFWKKKELLNDNVLSLVFSLITDTTKTRHFDQEPKTPIIQQVDAIRDLVCECFDLWIQTNQVESVLDFIHSLISSSSSTPQANNTKVSSNNGTTHTNGAHSTGYQATQSIQLASLISGARGKNVKCLRELDLLPRILRLLPHYENIITANDEDSAGSFNIDNGKVIYLIRQIVFELLNKTPRQADLLYFGQFLASLLPLNESQERANHTINLRNILLKSLLQMMTKNKQASVNRAMQEELVRILGFDWFMLFFTGISLSPETTSIGFLNFMVILSNDSLYSNFASTNQASGNNNQFKGGWLKEPYFGSIDGKFNIQLLGINVGFFFGTGTKEKSIKQSVLDSSNLFLLTSCLRHLVNIPNVYLMLYMLILNKFDTEFLDHMILDTIGAFDKLTFDSLCDFLVGETHHKRRKTLANIELKCHELVVSLVYMIREIMSCYPTPNCDQQEEEKANSLSISSSYEFPTHVIKFLMYLYNNNRKFQLYCRRSDDLMLALCDCLMIDETHSTNSKESSIQVDQSKDMDDWTKRAISEKKQQEQKRKRQLDKPLSKHKATKEVLELSLLITLDCMTEVTRWTDPGCEPGPLHAFESFMNGLKGCREAQNEMIHKLMTQIMLMIDSTARNHSIQTMGSSQALTQFQMLLVNSIQVAQLTTDQIWSCQLYDQDLAGCLRMIDHQLCLTEQVFKFNEMLPRQTPPHAFTMQRTLNRMLLFALSRPILQASDKLLLLELLKQIHNNRNLIIINHMPSENSAEFFICLTHCLIKIMETSNTNNSVNSASLIERQYGHPQRQSPDLANVSLSGGGPNSTTILLYSMARKVWDSLFQGQKNLLSEALDVPLTLPAFTLDTSIDLMQLKLDIGHTCERYWCQFVEQENKPQQRAPLWRHQSDQSSSNNAPMNAASSAVNMLSGRLTKVVNAASFVSRVVGVTAGNVASNVNMVGERLSQSTRRKGGVDNNPAGDTTKLLATSQGVHCNNGNSSGQQNLTSYHQKSSIDSSGGNANVNNQNVVKIGFKHETLSKFDVDSAFQTHIMIIEDYMTSHLAQKNHKIALHKYVCEDWLDMEYEQLLRERAIFGPTRGSELDKWCLDMTEGPKRMRKKMFNNTRQFYENYPYNAELHNPDNKSLRYRPPMSIHSQEYYYKTLKLNHHFLSITSSTQPTPPSSHQLQIEPITKQTLDPQEVVPPQENSYLAVDQSMDEQGVPPEIKVEIPSPTHRALGSGDAFLGDVDGHNWRLSGRLDGGINGHSAPGSEAGLTNDDGDSTSFGDFDPEIEAETNSARESENIDSLSVLRLLEKYERISHMFRCSRVQGLDTHEGLMLFGREHFYLIDGFTLLKTREIKDIDSLPADAHDPIIPNSTPNLQAHSKKTCAKFAFDGVVEVHKRRYLLQPIALEVFSSDGRNSLIVFPRNIRNKVYSRLMSVSTQLNSNVQESLAGQKSNVSVESGGGLFSNLIGETSVTQRWVRGELSNFQYLMNLNTIAGRSYNDLMQYPIFPWILADYSSEYLDLTKPSNFRDLSRPVGAQTSERLDQFKRRFAEWDDSETPPYHYGTFYSSAMIVASYMVRMEPFTQHFLRLQGGHFDLADRMFHSIHDSWLSASKHNMADIKELIPEFFYLPEFLNNDNRYDLGIKQNAMKLDNVILPPWAKGDAREFIRLHRSALESEYVSAHLHEWIDLIFGYKQQGPAAIDAVNVFHHLFYEGNVDIYNTDIDPIKKNAVIGFINNFGQVPKQLFKKPHPARKILHSYGPLSSLSGTPSPILPSISVAGNSSFATGHQHPGSRNITYSPQALRPSTMASNFKDLKGPVGQIVHIDKTLVAVEQNKHLIPPEYCRYVAWGHADRSLRLGLYDSEKSIFVWETSDTIVASDILCCTIPNNRAMITGGTDCLITVWKIERMKSFKPILNLYGHIEPITCLASSQAYSVIVSGSRDKTAIIWDLNRFTFSRQLGAGKITHPGPISAIAINDSTGDIATCAASWLFLWTINGELLAKVDAYAENCRFNMRQMMNTTNINITNNQNPQQLHILSVCFSQFREWSLDEIIVTGGSDGSVSIWSMRYNQEAVQDDKTMCDETGNKQVERPQRPQLCDLDSVDDVLEDSQPETAFNSRYQQDSNPNQEDNFAAAKQRAIARRRERTDTINSDWVKLSNSSTTSTIEHIDSTTYSSNNETTAVPNPAMPIAEEASDQQGTPTKQADEHPEQSPPSQNDGDKLSKLSMNSDDPLTIKCSKSESCIVDTFVMLSVDSPPSRNDANNENSMKTNQSADRNNSKTNMNPQILRPKSSTGSEFVKLGSSPDEQSKQTSAAGSSKLNPGHIWRRQLYLRNHMRRDTSRNHATQQPAAVTSLTISKDHRTIFVGDASGKVTSWTV